MALKHDILKAGARRVETVTVPEWGGVAVRVRALSGNDRDRYEMALYEGRKSGAFNPRALLVALSVVHETGERVFADADIDELGAIDARGLDRVFDVAQRLSGIGAAALEQAAGNSAAPDGGGRSSGSDSPSAEPPANSSAS